MHRVSKKKRGVFVHNFFSANTQNMKNLWSGIKTIISNKSSTSSSINKIKDKEGNVISEPGRVSNILMTFL